MTQVRPTLPPTGGAPAPSGRAEQMTLRELAQAFQAALKGPAEGAPKPAAANTPVVYAQPVQRLPDPPAEAPTRILRPGSLLDIRV